jgi:hypothetical protein
MPKSKPISKKLKRCTNASSNIILGAGTRQAKEAIKFVFLIYKSERIGLFTVMLKLAKVPIILESIKAEK